MTPIHINLDDAWNSASLPAPMRTIDARPLGPHLRYIAPEKIIQRSLDVITQGLAPTETTLLYGSGDFHYLAAWWLKRAIELQPADNRGGGGGGSRSSPSTTTPTGTSGRPTGPAADG